MDSVKKWHLLMRLAKIDRDQRLMERAAMVQEQNRAQATKDILDEALTREAQNLSTLASYASYAEYASLIVMEKNHLDTAIADVDLRIEEHHPHLADSMTQYLSRMKKYQACVKEQEKKEQDTIEKDLHDQHAHAQKRPFK